MIAPAGGAVAVAGTAVATISGINSVKDLASLATGNGPSSTGGMQGEVEKGQAPKGVDRVDKGRGPNEKDHVHFGQGEKSPALDNDGLWKHNPTSIPRAIRDWLVSHNWGLLK